MNTFVARENIRRFRDRLWSETDGSKRARLRDLLLAEEDKLGADLATLAYLERNIADARRRIELQRSILDGTKDGDQRALERAILENMIESEKLFREIRDESSASSTEIAYSAAVSIPRRCPTPQVNSRENRAETLNQRRGVSGAPEEI